uniref:Uncharacterized protein LOC111134100 isoform X2 n=1 Tax=Crassostrea virginica TaxID=6565 RepID=A0A8B8EEU1_CRAVI|nr:uncharacterized protein LOC111134100 isoform X2 [Crassostrea virginica]
MKACIGTFGDNCSGGPCKEGYYGFGCQSKCNCSTHQQCDRIKGCTNLTTENSETKDEGNDNLELIPIMSAAFFLVILILTSIIVFKRRTIFMKKVSGLRSSRHLNDTIENSSEIAEDFSQMVRSSTNYNILSFNRRFRAISTVNAPIDEDFYDDMASVSTAERNIHETYVKLATHKNHTLPMIKDRGDMEVYNENRIETQNETSENKSYFTLESEFHAGSREQF